MKCPYIGPVEFVFPHCSNLKITYDMMCSKSWRCASPVGTVVLDNDDLLVEILSLLPARSVVRLKLVSKRWRSLISAPAFIRLHGRCSSRRRVSESEHSFVVAKATQYFVCRPGAGDGSLIPYRFEFEHVGILQSCNGLLLLSCRKTDGGRQRYYVFNPTTRQSRELPPVPRDGSTDHVHGFSLMFDPSVSPHYRVVCFFSAKEKEKEEEKDCKFLFHVYDSESREWKAGGQGIAIDGRRNMSFQDGIYYNGGIYFLRFQTCSYRLSLDHDMNMIISKIPNPPRSYSRNYAVESNGFLVSLTIAADTLIMYETKEIDKGWTRSCCLDLKPMLAAFGLDSCKQHVYLLGVMRGLNHRDSLLLFLLGPNIVLYRFSHDAFELLADLTSHQNFNYSPWRFRFKNCHHFIQTLAAV